MLQFFEKVKPGCEKKIYKNKLDFQFVDETGLNFRSRDAFKNVKSVLDDQN